MAFVMSTNSDCTGSTSGSILSTSHVKLLRPLYGRILTAFVPRRLGSLCSAARNTDSISDAASFGLWFAITFLPGSGFVRGYARFLAGAAGLAEAFLADRLAAAFFAAFFSAAFWPTTTFSRRARPIWAS